MNKLMRCFFIYLIAIVILTGTAATSFIHAASNGASVAPQVKFGKPISATGVKASWNGNVTVTISLRDENGNEYSTQLVINNGMTSGSFTLEGIPAGVNYILTAIAEDSIGQKATLKAILPQIAVNSTVNVAVDGLTTKVVDALELIAARQGITVHKLPSTIVQEVQNNFNSNPNASPEEVADHFAYTVSGRVIDTGNNGIAGVTIGFSNGTTVTTGADGSWSKSGLSGAVTVTPTKSGYSFTPVSTQVTGAASNIDFTGTVIPTTYAVSGKVTDAGNNGIAGVTIGFSNGTTVTTGADGSWSKSGLSGTVTVTPTKSGYSFTPVSTQVTGAASNIDFTGTVIPTTYAVSGKVTDAGNNGIAGVTIGFSNGTTVTTGADGSWSKSGLSGAVTVTPTKSGYSFTPVSTQVTGAASNIDFTGTVIPTTYAVSGKVTDAGNNGIAGVTISFSNGTTVTTGADGSWSKSGLSGAVTVTPTKSGWTFNPATVSVSAANTSVNFTGTANPSDTYRISGKVIDNYGSGMAGVTIQFDDGTSVTTDNNGLWGKNGFTGSVKATPKKQNWTFTPASISVISATSDMNFTGKPNDSYSAFGKVVDTKGAPLKGVKITIGGNDWELTDELGQWGKICMTSSGTRVIKPSKDGWIFSPESADVNINNPQADFIASEAPYSASGAVKDEQGVGIADVTISFDGGFTSVKTDSWGNWSKNGLTGEVKVIPAKTGWTFAPVNRVVNRSSAVANFTGTTVKYQVSGTVVDNAGNGIGGVTISFSGGYSSLTSVTTDDKGYWFKTALDGTVVVTPSKARWSFDPTSTTVSQTTNSVNFTGTISPSYAVSGRVTDKSGAGISGVTVSFTGGYATVASVTTDANGNWSQTGLEGQVTVVPAKTGWTFASSYDIVNGANSNVNFTAYYSISGKVTYWGSAVSGVTINFSGGYGSVTTDTAGKWSVTNLSGPVTVKASLAGWHFDPVSVNVNSPNDSVDFTGLRTYQVSGKVLDGSGKGIENVYMDFDIGGISPRTDANGNWVKADCYGTATVTPDKEGWVFNPSSIVVTSNNASNINFTGSNPNATSYSVSGKVTDEKGNGIADVTIGFSNGIASVITNAQGFWTQSGLTGTVTVTPTKAGKVFDPVSISVSNANSAVNFTGKIAYRLFGKVTNDYGYGLANVTISFSGGFTNVTTDANGNWQKSDLYGPVVVTPTKSGFHFTPSSTAIESIGTGYSVDFKGLPTYSINGRAVDRYNQGIPGVTISFSNGYGSVTTDANGYWSKSDLFGEVTVTPSKAGMTFNPVNKVVQSGLDVNIYFYNF